MTSQISVLIPTLNEAAQIENVVQNASQLGKVFVIDSCSSDRTQELARAAGAVVAERAFDDFSSQKNWALENLQFEGEWILVMDADQRLSPALIQEIRRALEQQGDSDAFLIPQRLISFGKSMRPRGFYPAHVLQLFRRGRARFDGHYVHEQLVCDGRIGRLEQPLLHLRHAPVSQLIDTLILFSDLRSREICQHARMGSPSTLAFPAPLRSFLKIYLLQGGGLAGTAGWRFAKLMASYEYMSLLLCRDRSASDRR